MSSNRRSLKLWFSAWLPVLLGIVVITIESTESFGADHTSRPLRIVYEFLFGHVRDAQWRVIHHYLRKTGHFLGYGAIGLAWLRAWWMTLPASRYLQDALLALLGTALIAGSDEIHQSFLPNRTSSIWDVLLDCSGAITLLLLTYIYMHIFRPRQLARTA